MTAQQLPVRLDPRDPRFVPEDEAAYLTATVLFAVADPVDGLGSATAWRAGAGDAPIDDFMRRVDMLPMAFARAPMCDSAQALLLVREALAAEWFDDPSMAGGGDGWFVGAESTWPPAPDGCPDAEE